MSRADKDREQAIREANQQLAKFARDLSAGKTGMLDRFGAKVEKDDFVLYRPQHDLIFEVKDVRPNMNPMLPVGTVILVLECQTDVQFIASQRAMTVIKCGTKARDADGQALPGQADITAPGSETPADTPPADEPPAEAPPGPPEGTDV